MPETKPTTALTSLFEKFCGPHGARHGIEYPFYQDGRMFATNGRIAISVVLDEPGELAVQRTPKMEQVMDYISSPTIAWDPAIASCFVCEGTGVIESDECDDCGGTGECGACEGTGTETCFSCGHDHDCEDCDGDGGCHSCNGDGAQELRETLCCLCEGKHVDIGDRKLSIEVARKINLLSNVRWAVVKKSELLHLLVFEADNGIRGIATTN